MNVNVNVRSVWLVCVSVCVVCVIFRDNQKKGEKLVKNGKIQNNIITRGVVLLNRPMSVCNIIPYGTVYYSTFSSIIRTLIPFWNSLDRFLNGPRTKNDRKKCFMSKSTAVFVMITSSVKIKTTLPHYRLSRYTQ